MFRLIISCVLGIIVGIFLPEKINTAPIFTISLPILILSVGISLGNINLRELVRQNKKLILFPLISLSGSIIFSVLFAVLFGFEIQAALLTAGAMGFYSVPTVMVSAQLGAIPGTLVLVSNMLRESITILTAPILKRFLGSEAIIAVGGSTTMDTSLAMIKEVGGNKLVPIAILNGLILSLGVPLLTGFLINI
jgi:uncharacterized membrane protein YbjE (DUF340 family)